MKTYRELCPFRKGCAMERIYSAMAASAKPQTTAVIAKKAHVNFDTTQRMLLAMRNIYHNAPLRRAGVAVTLNDGGYGLAHAKPQPKASRPERGVTKKKPAKAKKKVKSESIGSAKQTPSEGSVAPVQSVENK